jgi:hypothetical protein
MGLKTRCSIDKAVTNQAGAQLKIDFVVLLDEMPNCIMV